MGFLLACILTVAVETPFLALAGYRGREDLTIIVCVNVATNLLLNLGLALLHWPGAPAVFWLEAAVVAAEYAVYALAFGRSRRLFLLTLAVNCLSFGTGLFLQALFLGSLTL